MNKFTKQDFLSLVKFLRENGYNVTTELNHAYSSRHEITGYSAYVNGKNIRAAFVWVKNEYGNFYRYLEDKIAADHVDCFDKWSKCAMVANLPANHQDILRWLKIMGTKQAYELSNSYERIPGIPYELNDGWFSA